MIKTERLRKQFGDLVAVDDISFDIAAGEVFGLLGPNGAGKTTTIKMLLGVLHPDGGRIEIDGDNDPTVAAVRSKLGAAPQSLAVYDTLTAQENLVFFARLYGLSGAELKEQVAWALEFVGLTDRKDSRVKTFSGGMSRRLNLACAVVHRPPVLLLDEPTVGVDPQSRNMIFESIEKLIGEGRTVIYTTHYMEEAERLCDRVAIVDHGKILALDTVDNLIDAHGGKSVIEGELETVPDRLPELFAGIEGTHFRIETDAPLQDVARISEAGIRFRTLRVVRADLETVFLNLTGRSLRD